MKNHTSVILQKQMLSYMIFGFLELFVRDPGDEPPYLLISVLFPSDEERHRIVNSRYSTRRKKSRITLCKG